MLRYANLILRQGLCYPENMHAEKSNNWQGNYTFIYMWWYFIKWQVLPSSPYDFPRKSHFLLYKAYKREVDPTHLKFYNYYSIWSEYTREKKKKIQCTLHLFSKVSYCTKPYLAIMKTFGFSYTRRLTDWNIMVNSLTTIMSIISFVIPLYRQMILNLNFMVKYLHFAYC